MPYKYIPFDKDSPEGTTHYENDGCGEPAHNKMINQVSKCCQMPPKTIQTFSKKKVRVCSSCSEGFIPDTQDKTQDESINFLRPLKPTCCGKCGKEESHNVEHECGLSLMQEPSKLSKCCGAEMRRYPKDTKQSNGSIIPIWADRCLRCGVPFIPSEEEKKCNHYLHGSKDFICPTCEHDCGGGGYVTEIGGEKFCARCDINLDRSKIAPIKDKESWEEEFENLPNTGMTTKEFIRQVESQAREECYQQGRDDYWRSVQESGVYKITRESTLRDCIAEVEGTNGVCDNDTCTVNTFKNTLKARLSAKLNKE